LASLTKTLSMPMALIDLIVHVPISMSLKPRDRLTVMCRICLIQFGNYLNWKARESRWAFTVRSYRIIL